MPPFGIACPATAGLMPGRHMSDESYRFGFNGMEKDDEVKGNGNSYDFGARMYDSRLGRWLSVDALEGDYPAVTPYCFVANRPIEAIDPDGSLIIFINGYNVEDLLVSLGYSEVSPGWGTGANGIAAEAIDAAQ